MIVVAPLVVGGSMRLSNATIAGDPGSAAHLSFTIETAPARLADPST